MQRQEQRASLEVRLQEGIDASLREVGEGNSEGTRLIRSAAIKMFYRRNDSPLTGDFSLKREEARPVEAPLLADDIRTVLKTLPLHI